MANSTVSLSPAYRYTQDVVSTGWFTAIQSLQLRQKSRDALGRSRFAVNQQGKPNRQGLLGQGYKAWYA
jgi:hypothetical protein